MSGYTFLSTVRPRGVQTTVVEPFSDTALVVHSFAPPPRDSGRLRRVRSSGTLADSSRLGELESERWFHGPVERFYVSG